MSLFYDPLRMMRAEYNKHHETNLPLEAFVVEKISDLRNFEASRSDNKNTMVIVNVQGESHRFFYDRIPFTPFFRDFGLDKTSLPSTYRMILDRDSNGSTKKLARPIARAYGLPITEDDIIDQPFSPPMIAAATPVTITFSPDSLLFLPGTTATFIIDEAYRVINGLVYMLKDFSRVPDSFYEDHVADSRTNNATYLKIAQLTYGKDYSPIAPLLARLVGSTVYVAGETIGGRTDSEAFCTMLAGAMSQCDGLPWTFVKSANANYNLYGASVVYNGPVEGCKQALAVRTSPVLNTPEHLVRTMEYGNTRYDNVALLLINPFSNNTTRMGALLHYNNP